MRAVLDAALAEKGRLLTSRGVKRARATELNARRHGAEAKRAADQAQLLAVESEAMAAGREPDSGKVAELEVAIRAAAREIRSCKAAAARLRAEADAMSEDITAADLALTGASLAAYKEMRDKAAKQVRAGLKNLAPAFAALLASDEVRKSLIGTEWTFSTKEHTEASLWSGAEAASSLINGVWRQLTPDGLRNQVETAARKMVDDTLAGLNREASND